MPSLLYYLVLPPLLLLHALPSHPCLSWFLITLPLPCSALAHTGQLWAKYLFLPRFMLKSQSPIGWCLEVGPWEWWGLALMTRLVPFCLGWCGSLDWTLACKLKGRWFDSRPGYMPGLWAGSPIGAYERQPHIDVPLPLFLPPFPSL